MFVPEYVEFTLQRLEQNGFCAYLVGGCVRDYLMHKTPYDYDITTNATPGQILGCFSDVRTLDQGLKHGTVALVFDKNIVEVTTFRVDGEYKDNRRPENVEFTDKIELDLARRDFTVNAIAYSKTKGFADPYCGQNDIKNKRIVCVGIADERFCEDALRIMRALRFSSVLCFNIEENTKKAIYDKSHLLLNISMERINTEFCKMLSGKNVKKVFCEYFDVLCTFIPEIAFFGCQEIKTISSALEKARDNLTVSLCVLFCFLSLKEASEQDIKRLLMRLKFSKIQCNDVVSVLTHISCDVGVSLVDVKKIISSLGYDISFVFYKTLMCLDLITKEQYDNALEIVGNCRKENVVVKVSQLAINGNDLINNTQIEKKNFSGVLETLLCEVIEEKIENTFDSLINRAKLLDNQQFYGGK